MRPMKLMRFLSWTIVLAAGLVPASPAISQEPDPLATLRPGHPRLIVTKDQESATRQLLKSQPKVQEIFRDIQADADRILGQKPIEHRLIGPRLLDQSRRCLDRVYTLATVYRLTGDKRYAERAIREMLTAADFPDWNPSHFLDTAEMTHALAIGYDWLYPIMSATERDRVRAAIVEKGLKEGEKVYRKGTWWVKTPWNWNQVCNGGMTIGALAVAHEEPALARYIVSQAVASLPHAMANYAPDGAWAEGPGYWSYATHYTVYMLASLETALGTDFGLSNQPGFDRTGDFRIHVIGPSGLAFNFADGSASVGGAPAMLWLARRFDRPLYAWHELEMVKKASSPLHLWWFLEATASLAQEPTSKWFRQTDIVTLRSEWSDNAVFVGLKGGSNAVNHSHLELGSFVMDAQKLRWVLDLGGDNYNLPGYFGGQRWSYYRLGTEGQNTLLLDGANQNPRAIAPIVAFQDRKDRKHAVVDLTEAYKVDGKKTETGFRVQRGIAILGRDWVLIQDELTGCQGRTLQWQVHTEATIAVQEKHAQLTLGDKTVTAIILNEDPVVFETLSANPPPPQRQNPNVARLVVRTKVPSDHWTLAVAFRVNPAATLPLPTVAPLAEWEKAQP